MKRRDFIKSFAALTAAMSAVSCTKSGRKPNIVFILIDDLGWADIGCYGNKFNETPHINNLAKEGMRFTDAYAACPVCSPTRASLMSGQYPARIGLTDFIHGHWRPFEKLRVPINKTQYLPLEKITFAEALQKAGYVSGAFGKWHLGGKDYYPDKQGFDDYRVTSGWGHFFPPVKSVPSISPQKGSYLAEVLTDQAERFMEENRDNPFCLYLSHFAVHIPLEANKELVEKYQQKPKPAEGINNPVYAAMVEHIDNSVGRVLAKIDQLGLRDDTIVFFFSDNGGLTERFDKADGVVVTTNSPLRGEKGSLYEGGIREPLIVRWPGKIKAGTKNSTSVTSVDFYPTFLECASIQINPSYPLDGKSLLPLLKQNGNMDREAIYWHYPHYHHSTPASAIRSGDYKLIEFFEDSHLELYNLKEDIGEKNNLAEKMPDKAAALLEKLRKWRKSVKAELPTLNPDFNPEKRYEWGRHPGK